MFEPPTVEDEVVLVGRSNVGKTTLMREIVGKKYDVGSRPGVTLEPNRYEWNAENFAVTDLPGFGFMSGVDDERREQIKDGVVRYLEDNADSILVAVHVIDASAFIEIVDRWRDRGEVPHDIDLHAFLRDVGVPVVVAANKTDKVDDRDATLDGIAERLGYPPPWQQWDDVIAPTFAKRGSTDALFDAVRANLSAQGRDDLL
ncbi:MAG: GTP-binding protein EngB, partial [Halobacteria archaeon]